MMEEVSVVNQLSEFIMGVEGLVGVVVVMVS